MAQNTRNLGKIVKHAHKKAEPVKLTSLVNFGRPSGSGSKKGFKRIHNQKSISDQMYQHYNSNGLGAIVTDHATNISEMLTKKAHLHLKTFAKQNHHFLLIKMSLCKLPKMQQYKLIIRNGKISCCNSCLNEFNRENLKLCIIGRNVYDWHVNVHKQENTRMYKLGRQN